MKRLIITGPRSATFEEVAIPPCPTGGILVKARVTAVSAGTELRVYRAEPVDEAGEFLYEWVPFSLPAENGYSMVGEVIETGGESRDLFGQPIEPGDRVFLTAAHKEYAVTGSGSAIKLSENISDECASLLNILEVGHIALRRGRPSPGANLCVIGLGLVGLSVVAYGKAFGLRTAALDLSEERLALARRMGCDCARLAGSPQSISEVRDFFDGAGADLVVEAAAASSAIQAGLDILREKGTCVVVARHLKKPDFNPFTRPYFGKQIHITSSYAHPPEGHRWDRKSSMRLTLRLMHENRLAIQPMITHRGSWSEIPDFYRRLDHGEPGLTGVVVGWPCREQPTAVSR